MRKVARLMITVLFLQFFIGGVSAEAATALRINSVSVGGTNVTVKWTATKLTSKDYFEVEFTKAGAKPKFVKTRSTEIIAKLDAFSKYTVRVRKNLSPKIWSSTRTFAVTAAPVSGIAISNSTHTAIEVNWPAVVGAKAYEVALNKGQPITTVLNKYTFTGLKPGYFGSFTVRAISGVVKGESSQQIQFSTLSTGPAKLAASAITSTGFTLTWETIAGATAYNVYKDKTLFGTTTLATLAVSGQVPGSSADFSVKAVVGGSETDVSETLQVTTLVDIPKKPVISGITSISATITWNIDANADSYQVKLYDSLGTTLIKDIDAQKSIGSTVVTGLSPLTTYTVGVINVYSKTSSKISDLSSFATLKPSITGLAAAAVTINSATISWSPLPNATFFEVLRDSVVVAVQIPISTISYTFTSLSPGQTYKFGVRATYTDGNKILSGTDVSEISVTLITDPSGRPAISTAPVITLPYANVPIIGATLTVNTGTWSSTPGITSYSYQWQRSLDSGSTWSDLAGATSSNYVVNVGDSSHLLRARVSATNVNGTGISTTVATGVVASVYNIQVPIVRGNAVLGQVLEVSDGTWSSPYPITLSYKWKRGSDFILNATSPSYTVTADDVGLYISGQVTASTSFGALAINSANRGIVTPVGNSVAPAITGTLRVGGTLSLSTGTWLNLESDSSATYQWQSSSDAVLWNNISGATSATYVLQLGQAGLYIRGQVFQTKTGYTAVLANSAATAVVPTLNLTNTVTPAVTGAWTVGTSISASTGTWSTSGTYTYQWQSSSDNSTWSDIASATSSSYTLTSSEASKYVRVQVINTSAAGSGVAYSVARSKVGAPFNTTLPAITGTIKVGSTQTVSTGTWSNTPTAYSYQWQKSADGISWSNLSGETASTYVPTFDVANLRIRVSVGAGNAVETATVTTAIVSGFLPPQATAIPVVTGTMTVGQTLTSTSGTWPGTIDSYVYQWQRSSDSGVTWTNILGATASTYVLVAADAGYQIRSQVSLTTNTGSSSAYSLPRAG